jgi:hypothetical protein
MIRAETLKKLFEDRLEKSTIAIKGKCSDCGCDVTIDITPTSAGFGLNGGVLFEDSQNGYLAKCLICFELNPMITVH